MKIAFITGSLEPGRTGVGDYTRLLAAACQRMGHEVRTIALEDMHTPTNWEGQQDGIPCLRLPKEAALASRMKMAARFLELFEPEWISLQFVPYAFHPKGLFFEFLKEFPELIGGRRLHIKFHEIWIGEYPGAPLKERLTGWIQKRLVRKLILTCRPRIINYTNAGAKVRLARAGIAADHLPIFGNIQVAQEKSNNWLLAKLTDALPKERLEKDNFLWFGFFGSIHQNWPARQILERLRMFTTAKNQRPALLHAGILGKHRYRWRAICKKYSGDWFLHSLGELPEDQVSQYLFALDFGLSSTPWDLVGKSGTIAAMTEHGLPVIINLEGGTPDAPLVIQNEFEPLIQKADEQLLTKLSTLRKRKPMANNIEKVATLFLQSLQEKGKHA